MRTFYWIIVSCVFTTSVYAQKEAPKSVVVRRPVNTGYFTVGAGVGISSFFGDLNFSQNVNSLSSFRLNYFGQVEKRFGKLIGLSASGGFGKIAQNERSLARNINFETRLIQFGGALMFHFDWSAENKVSPFFSGGFNYTSFDIYSDMRDAQGNTYFYWSDGRIRVLPQKDSSENLINYSTLPTETQRDYTYETRQDETFDPSKNSTFSKNCFAFPITAGIKIKMAEFVDARISATYQITNSDYMDNYWNGVNDAFASVNFSLHYTIGEKYIAPEELAHKDVDFKSIMKEDADFDNVADILDECPHTPKGISVDSRGCPIDEDGDGVANYLDKEPSTLPGAVVNRDGITLTETELKKLYELRESTYMDKINKFYELPTEETLKKIAEDLNKVIVLEEASNSSNLPSSIASNNTTESTTTKEDLARGVNIESPQNQDLNVNLKEEKTIEKDVNTTYVKQSPENIVVEVKNNSEEPVKPESPAIKVVQDIVEIKKDTVSVTPDLNKVLEAQAVENTQKSAEVTSSTPEKVLVLPMPTHVRFADANADGMLQAKEITGSIDAYLEGEIDVTVTDIMDMIDYFFSQQ